MTEQKSAPSSHENEMIVLGCMLNNERSFKIAAVALKDVDFYFAEHKVIFQTLETCHKKGKPADVHIVAEELKQKDKLKTVGGVAYLVSLAQYAGTSAHIEAYCESLQEKRLERDLLNVTIESRIDLEKGADPSKVLSRLETQIQNIKANKPKADSVFRYLLDNNSEAALIEEIRNISPGISTGFTIGDIDLKIPGGAISIVAAPTSHGKTSVLINLSLGALEHHHDKTVFFFTYEESGSSIVSKFLNTWMGKELSKNNRESIKSHFIKGNVEFIKEESRTEFLRDKKAFFDSLIDNGRLKVVYSDMCAEELVAAIHFLKKNTNIGLVCIDYMQLLKMLDPKGGSRQEELKQICLMLKNCAVETGLPILLSIPI